MLFERLIPTEDCSLCELQDICNVGYVSIPSYSAVTCEAFKTAVREYGGKEKLLDDLSKANIFDYIIEYNPFQSTRLEDSNEIKESIIRYYDDLLLTCGFRINDFADIYSGADILHGFGNRYIHIVHNGVHHGAFHVQIIYGKYVDCYCI